MTGKSVCVIGAGISGLVSAKILSGDGFDVTLFEKEPEFGGTWITSRTYPGLHTNNARQTYCFSDYPYPETADLFPSAEQVRAYLRSYAERFQILSKIELNTEVIQVAQDCAGQWRVDLRNTGDATPGTRTFDFVVVCNGVFNKPKMPTIEGRARFAGRIMHSSQSIQPEDVKGKRVVVVGGSKSAADCAVLAARDASSSTILFRRPHWLMPRYMFGFVNMDFVIATRFIEFFMPYYRLTPGERFFHRTTPALSRIADWIVLNSVRLHLGMPKELTPDVMPLAQAFETSGLVEEFPRMVRGGSIRPQKGEIECILDGQTILLKSGEKLEADVLIFATGWKQEVQFLEENLRKQIQRDDGFHLYRTILPPMLHSLGFVGYNSSTSCQFTSEIAANWLSDVFLGRMRLPNVEDMEDDIRAMQQWVEQEMPDHRGGYYVGPYISHHVDDLMRDMGLPVRRTENFIVENFFVRWPARYAALPEERKNRLTPPKRRFRWSAAPQRL